MADRQDHLERALAIHRGNHGDGCDACVIAAAGGPVPSLMRAMGRLCCPRCGWVPGERAEESCDECAPARAAWVVHGAEALA